MGEYLRGSHIVSEQGPERGDGYRAFISYSHRDDGIAKTLHKRLETYRLPKKLIGRPSERGPIPARLNPIFRDLDELSAADDLSVEIKAALARSEVLIILCSPGAKASKWVNLEIETFRALHGNSRPVLAALIEGEPADAFPPALTANGQEPVAADFRKNAPGGKRLALLKLVAGITAAPLDALVQRDAQRQYRRVMAITGGALAASLVMALLLVVALRSQAEAQRQRQEAEGLVEYMLTDLRDKLKGVGRLDVMTAVNERAMRYYGGQDDLSGLPADSLLRRARILVAMGQDDGAAGQQNNAIRKFKEAHRITAELLSNEPKESSRIFAHASSENRIGLTYGNSNRLNTALTYHVKARHLIDRLLLDQKSNPEWITLYSHINSNICSVLIRMESNYKLALQECSRAVQSSLNIINNSPFNKNARYNLIFQYIWLSDAYIKNNNIKEAIESRYKALSQTDQLTISEPHNTLWKEQKVEVIISHAKFLKFINKEKESTDYLNKGRKIIVELINIDRSNLYWRELSDKINNKIKENRL